MSCSALALTLMLAADPAPLLEGCEGGLWLWQPAREAQENQPATPARLTLVRVDDDGLEMAAQRSWPATPSHVAASAARWVALDDEGRLDQSSLRDGLRPELDRQALVDPESDVQAMARDELGGLWVALRGHEGQLLLQRRQTREATDVALPEELPVEGGKVVLLGGQGDGCWLIWADQDRIACWHLNARGDTTLWGEEELPSEEWQVEVIGGLPVLAWQQSDGIFASVWSQGSLTEFIRLADAIENEGPWTLVPDGGRLWVVWLDPEKPVGPDALQGRSVRLAGGGEAEITVEDGVSAPPGMGRWGMINQMLQVVGLGVAIVAWIVSSLRGVAGRTAQLKDGQTLAGVGIRMAAGFLDLSIASLIALRVLGVEFQQAVAMGPAQMPPAMVAQGGLMISVLLAAHTGLGELLTGRSIGKMMLGLKVVGLDGQRARPIAVLLRTLCKPLELINPFLLALIAFTPLRQRVGDLLAGTLVVRAPRQRPEEKQQP